MAETVSVTIPHRLTKAEARERLENGLGRIHEQIIGKAVSVDQSWNGDHMDFRAAVMGQAITGRLDVEDRRVLLEIDLPWALAALAGRFKGRIEKETALLLEKK